MPQQDRHKDRRIPIEFDFYDRLETLPMKERCSIVLLSYGKNKQSDSSAGVPLCTLPVAV